MKNTLNTFLLLLSQIFFGCGDNTSIKLYFSTDKEEYVVGDDIYLDINIISENQQKKEIKILHNLKNVELWMMFVKNYKLQNGGDTTVASERGITNLTLEKNDKSAIKKITISRGKPFSLL